MTTVRAIAAKDTSGVLKRMAIERRAPEDYDVDVKIEYCGICHSDLHCIRSEWPGKMYYPMVPGHEMVGLVRTVGSKVTKFKTDWYGRSGPKTKLLPGYDSEVTFGGYSQSIVVDEKYVLRIPENLDSAAAAPLLCAGITTYSPLVYFGPKDLASACTTGVIGFGGLGHMAVKLARAMGNRVIVFSSSPSKKDAVEALGARFVCSGNPQEMTSVIGIDFQMSLKVTPHLQQTSTDVDFIINTCDFIMDTVSANHDLKPYLEALTVGGMLCILGAPAEPYKVHAMQVIGGRKTICGSCVGGLQETQDMLDFCAKHNIAADITLIHPKEVNHAINALSRKATMTNRFVIDIKGLDQDDWEVEDDAEIDPTEWKAQSEVFPPAARHRTHGMPVLHGAK